MWETKTAEPLMQDSPKGPQIKVRQDLLLLPWPFIDSLCRPWPNVYGFWWWVSWHCHDMNLEWWERSIYDFFVYFHKKHDSLENKGFETIWWEKNKFTAELSKWQSQTVGCWGSIRGWGSYEFTIKTAPQSPNNVTSSSKVPPSKSFCLPASDSREPSLKGVNK